MLVFSCRWFGSIIWRRRQHRQTGDCRCQIVGMSRKSACHLRRGVDVTILLHQGHQVDTSEIGSDLTPSPTERHRSAWPETTSKIRAVRADCALQIRPAPVNDRPTHSKVVCSRRQRISWSTVSKAADRSKRASEATSRPSTVSYMSDSTPVGYSTVTAVSVE